MWAEGIISGTEEIHTRYVNTYTFFCGRVRYFANRSLCA